MKIIGICLAALAATAPYCSAVETKSWTQNEQSDFEKGTLNKLSLRSDGRLTLAPVFREVFGSSVPYLWSIAEDSKGNLYTGGGGPSVSVAKLFRIDSSGKTKPVADIPGMEIHAIAIDKKDQVFAATDPDGKVYKITPEGKAELFYDPHVKYIWAIAFDSKGNLYVATGDQGEIHRVAPDGKGTVFFKTEETHARSMVVDPQDSLIVGTEPGGLILRITPAGEGLVLYQTSKREITAVAVAKDGRIYAAAVGSRMGASTPLPTLPLSAMPVPLPSLTPRPAPGSATKTDSPAAVPGGSELWRIEADNYPHKIWSHPQETVYAIGFDGEGRPLLGTGNKGRLYRIDFTLLSTLLVSSEPTQITAFASGKRGLFCVTGNIGMVFQIGPEIEKQGTFESEPLDAMYFSYWGRLRGKGHSQDDVRFETRSGNLDRPQKNWSPWSPLSGESRITSPAARFVQYRASFLPSPGSQEDLDEVELAYQAKNIAPAVEEIEITPPNYKFPPPAIAQGSPISPPSITLPPLGQRKRAALAPLLDLGGSQSLQYGKGFVSARWTANDPNGDELVFRVEIRGTKEQDWKLLRDKVKEKYITWDTTAFPDGTYLLRVTASDAPSNTAEQALSSTIESGSFVIDNTPPLISKLAGEVQNGHLRAHWSVRDLLTVIDKMEYSVDGKDWMITEPTTRLTDSQQHDYTLDLDALSAGEHVLAIRASDDYDNQSVDKILLH